MSWITRYPRISIVIPTYNHARFLAEAIRSALDQTWQDFEIIVVDDGSTDDTHRVVAQFGQSVKYIRQENGGLAAARNAGIRAARGREIGLLDADDVWLPDYLMTMLTALESDSRVGAVYCGWQYIDEAGNSLPRVNVRVVPPDQAYQAMVHMDFLVPSGVLVRRDCFDDLGLFDESLRDTQGCEDWDMWLRILKQYRMIGVPQALVKYRIYGQSMSSNLEGMERAKRAVIRKHFGEDEVCSTIARLAYGGLFLGSALTYLQHDQMEQGRYFLRRAFAVRPELAGSLDAFYQLALTSQPAGSRGVFQLLDFEPTAQKTMENLDAVFDADVTSREPPPRKSEAYGNAYLALALLAYGCKRHPLSRWYLLQALRVCPALIFHPQALPTLVRAFLGTRLVGHLKRLRKSLTTPSQ